MIRRSAAAEQGSRSAAGTDPAADPLAEDPDPASAVAPQDLVTRRPVPPALGRGLTLDLAPPGADRAPVAPIEDAARDFPVGPQAEAFRARCFPDATLADWNDWRWQLRNRVRNLDGLERTLRLSDEEREAVRRLGDRLPVGITPYYASLLDALDAQDPLRRTMVPVLGEFEESPGEADDPLGEDAHMPVPGLVHRYPDRVLFLVTSFCATYCRYCTRARMVGQTGEYHFNEFQFQRALDYIAEHEEIRDVLISGGDPLTMAG
jgi:lysine 2,3-aminomutase